MRASAAYRCPRHRQAKAEGLRHVRRHPALIEGSWADIPRAKPARCWKDQRKGRKAWDR
jgi:hypothetical protein